MSRTHVEIHLFPHWELINPAREFLIHFFGVSLRDPRLVEEIGMVAHELMENAVKYAGDNQATLRVEVEPGVEALIIVENRAAEENIAAVRAEVRALREVVDPMDYYRQKMELAVTRTDGKSCLGLTRIRCEAQMAVDCHVVAGRIRLSARRAL